MKTIKLIGVGGIGTCLLSFLPRFLAYQSKEPLELLLIDGNTFEASNVTRQSFSVQGNKAEVKARELATEFPSLTVLAIPAYVTSKNVRKMIRAGDTVLLAVDNHATRLLVSRRCQQLQNITLISVGNDLVTGSCQVYKRTKGVELYHPLEFFHPEIQNPQDENPGETLDCFQMAAAGDPQLVITNMAAALGMASVLYQLLEEMVPPEEIYFDISSGAFRPAERSMHAANSRS